MEQITIKAGDGFPLSATRYLPQGPAKAVILMPAAMGVKQDFYTAFAEYLAKQGFAVQTFDYRGMGQSRPEQYKHSLRGFEADITVWAEQDYSAALHAAKAWQPDVPLTIIGHSLGGQLPGLLPLPDIELIDSIVTVAAGSGYWHTNAPQLKRIVWFLWYFLVPVLLPLYGYFPGKKVGMVGDLPKGVMKQWSRWCRNPHYVSDEQGQPIRAGYDKLRIPMLGLAFTDDEMMGARGIDELHACYRNAELDLRRITPQQAGGRVGHFGFFRPKFEMTLWKQVSEWIADRALDQTKQTLVLHKEPA